MKLNINFDFRLEDIINTCEPLADWFERNQEEMAYFELTHKGCTYLEKSTMASSDIKTLGRMANAALMWLESPNTEISPEEKAINASFAIADIYDERKELLTDVARQKYYISVDDLQKNNDQGESVKKL